MKASVATRTADPSSSNMIEKVLALALCFVLGDCSKAPYYFLTEEHHHVASHLLHLADSGDIPSTGWTLLHFDSHHDAGLPSRLPVTSDTHGVAPAAIAEPHRFASDHLQINDFLIGLAIYGVLDHIIFVEPPWSRQLNSRHNLTAVLVLGISTESGVPMISFEDEDNAGELLGMFGQNRVLPVSELLEISGGKVSRVKFSVVALEDAEVAVPDLLEDIDRSNVILDIDLDAFATTSPGALAMTKQTLRIETLRTLYATLYDMCDFDDTAYWSSRMFRSNGAAKACNKIGKTRNVVPSAPLTKDLFNESKVFLSDLVHALLAGSSASVGLARRVAEIAASDLRTIVDHPQHRALNMAAKSFAEQPFFQPEDPSALDPLFPYWRRVLEAAFDTHTSGADSTTRVAPGIVTFVRSPFYCPAELLSYIERRAVAEVTVMFGAGHGTRYSTEVSPNRTGNVDVLPEPLIDVGSFEIARVNLWDYDAHILFFKDAVEAVEGTKPEEEGEVNLQLQNDHPEAIDIFYEDELWLAAMEPGSSLNVTTSTPSGWTFRSLEGGILSQHKVLLENGLSQTFSSVGGLILTEHTPVRLKLFHPSGYESNLIVHFDDGSNGTGDPFAVLKPGETYEVDSYHNDFFFLRVGELVVRRQVDAKHGSQQVWTAGGDEL